MTTSPHQGGTTYALIAAVTTSRIGSSPGAAVSTIAQAARTHTANAMSWRDRPAIMTVTAAAPKATNSATQAACGTRSPP